MTPSAWPWRGDCLWTNEKSDQLLSGYYCVVWCRLMQLLLTVLFRILAHPVLLYWHCPLCVCLCFSAFGILRWIFIIIIILLELWTGGIYLYANAHALPLNGHTMREHKLKYTHAIHTNMLSLVSISGFITCFLCCVLVHLSVCMSNAYTIHM